MNFFSKKKNRKLLFLPFTLLLLCFAYDNNLYAENKPIIDILNSLQRSIVTIFAQRTKIYATPSASARRDINTGRIILSRNLKTTQAQKSGAGVIIDSNGLIVTNAHTLSEADSISVMLYDKTRISGKIVFFSRNLDIAFIKIIPHQKLFSVEFANSEEVKLGDEIVTIGNSPLLKETLSGGKIIGLGSKSSKKSKGTQNIDMLQTSINLYKGDSGGPLFNREGDLLGLMVAGQIKKDHSSFAIPSRIIQEQYQKYLKKISTQEKQDKKE